MRSNALIMPLTLGYSYREEETPLRINVSFLSWPPPISLANKVLTCLYHMSTHLPSQAKPFLFAKKGQDPDTLKQARFPPFWTSPDHASGSPQVTTSPPSKSAAKAPFEAMTTWIWARGMLWGEWFYTWPDFIDFHCGFAMSFDSFVIYISHFITPKEPTNGITNHCQRHMHALELLLY